MAITRAQMSAQLRSRPMAKSTTKKSSFKPCAGCPSPAKCRAAGKCLKKAKKSRK